jgi:hypothetical protein
VSRHIIITSCTKSKSTQFIPGKYAVSPGDYLAKPSSVARLDAARSLVFALPNSAYDEKATQHYAFDLYVRDPYTKMYRGLRDTGLAVTVRERLLAGDDEIEWYFLSGGYGLLHALEIARPYQATFDRSIASKNKIPWTFQKWKPVLPPLLDEIFSQKNPSSVTVFGSTAYVEMVRNTNFYKCRPEIFKIVQGRAYDPKIISALEETVRHLLKA